MKKESDNLLIITFDQCRGDWLNPYNPIILLPNISKLSQKGIVFERCYTNSPQCVPARLSWLTGKEPSVNGITENIDFNINKQTSSIFRELQKKGWKTYIIGKTHWTSHRHPCDLRENEGLMHAMGIHKINEVAGPRALRHVQCKLTDEWKAAGVYFRYKESMEKRYCSGKLSNALKVEQSVLPLHLYPDKWIADQSIEELKNLSTNEPWILWVSFVGPHEPFDTPKTWNKRISRNTLIPRAREKEDWMKELPMECELAKQLERWDGIINKKMAAEIRRDYAARLILLDDQVGRLLRVLKKREDKDRTNIILTSDHGELLGDYGMAYKSCFLESSIRVPFIYKPTTENSHDMNRIKEPVQSNVLLKEIIQGIGNKNLNSAHNSMRNICGNTGAVSEFKDEIMLIEGNHKIVMNRRSKRLLWSTKLENKVGHNIEITTEEIKNRNQRKIKDMCERLVSIINQRDKQN